MDCASIVCACVCWQFFMNPIQWNRIDFNILYYVCEFCPTCLTFSNLFARNFLLTHAIAFAYDQRKQIAQNFALNHHFPSTTCRRWYRTNKCCCVCFQAFRAILVFFINYVWFLGDVLNVCRFFFVLFGIQLKIAVRWNCVRMMGKAFITFCSTQHCQDENIYI